jgi:hypothetical protein
MSAVHKTVNPNMKKDLATIRAKALTMSQSARDNFDNDVDAAVAEVIRTANIKAQIEAAVQNVIDDWNNNHL